MDIHISGFLEREKVATVCCVNADGHPLCFNCFYVYDPVHNCLYFKTSATAQHSILMNKDDRVSGTIQPSKLNPIAIRGIQFTGRVINSEIKSEAASKLYYQRYPFALAMQGEIRIIQLIRIKMTDSIAGITTKYKWEKAGATAANFPN